jgi:hypothetical protein
MSFISFGLNTTYKRQPAQIYVIRNDGFCWGRLVLKDGTNFDISTSRDYYEHDDVSAAEAFERAMRRGKVEEPMASWTIDYDEEEAQ